MRGNTEHAPTTGSLFALGLFVIVNIVLIRAALQHMARELAESKASGVEEPPTEIDDVIQLVSNVIDTDATYTDRSESPLSGKYRQLVWIAGILAADVWTIHALWPWLLS